MAGSRLAMRWICKFGGLGFAGAVMPWSWFFYKSQPTKPEASLGIKFPELEFRFLVFSAPGHMGAAFLKLQLSTCEA